MIGDHQMFSSYEKKRVKKKQTGWQGALFYCGVQVGNKQSQIYRLVPAQFALSPFLVEWIPLMRTPLPTTGSPIFALFDTVFRVQEQRSGGGEGLSPDATTHITTPFPERIRGKEWRKGERPVAKPPSHSAESLLFFFFYFFGYPRNL